MKRTILITTIIAIFAFLAGVLLGINRAFDDFTCLDFPNTRGETEIWCVSDEPVQNNKQAPRVNEPEPIELPEPEKANQTTPEPAPVNPEPKQEQVPIRETTKQQKSAASTQQKPESNCIDAGCSNHHGKPTPCPEGSYSIGLEKNGQVICKLEPTGCPFGDSVPMDKCAPPPDIKCNEDWSKCEPVSAGKQL